VSLLLYNIFLLLYRAAIGCYALFSSKAKKWIEGRKQWPLKMAAALQPDEKRIWVHCSSLGEFEQGRPLIESLKQKYPQYKIVITFFSPSGYEVQKNYAYADYVFYMPLDGKGNARKFIKMIDPSLAVFVKYEFWYYYLEELHTKKIPTIIISAAFRKEQTFFSWYGKLFRSLLHCFNWIFVQDEQSKKLLEGIGFDKNVSVSGDTRYDRVSAIAKNKKELPVAEKFKGSNKLLIAGSTWPDDEKVLKACISCLHDEWKLIIAPHEIDEAHIQSIQSLFSNETVLYSSLINDNKDYEKKVLIIDNIGLLSNLFAYGEIAFIGGGFQKGGIHNVLEPAVFGLPVIIGPVYEKFVEAKKLVDLQLAFAVNNEDECKTILQRLISDNDYRSHIHFSLIKFMQENIGATNAIIQLIEKEKWLL
jgi:3-deoxy-D-manno-octulosonic-acid transferase